MCDDVTEKCRTVASPPYAHGEGGGGGGDLALLRVTQYMLTSFIDGDHENGR